MSELDSITARHDVPHDGVPRHGVPRHDVPIAPRLLTSEHRAVTWRSVLIGTLAVAGICSLVPYNDFVFSNESLSAGYLPLASVLIMFFLIVVVNAPLHRFAPRQALSGRELAVVLLMTLVACSLPNWGLMRFFIPTPVAPFRIGAADAQFWKAFLALDLPPWLFPVNDVKEGRSDTNVTWFYSSLPAGEKIPWKAWFIPLGGWGVFIAAMLATLVCLARLVAYQWIMNERLPFPLLQVHSALIEEPEKGHAFNAMFRSPALWIGLLVIFAVHSLTGLHAYFPRNFPQIPISYDFSSLFADEPFVNLDEKVKKAAISFIVVGVTFFIRSRVSFSLWAIYLTLNFVRMQRKSFGTELPSAAWADQHLGASVVFVGAILWIGRHHWSRVLKNAFGAGLDNTYRWTFWIAAIGIGVMTGWLLYMGVHLWLAVLIVMFIIVAHLVVARVIAETGIPFFRSSLAVSQVYSNLSPSLMTGRDVYFASVFTALGPLTTRDGIMGMALLGEGACRNAGVDDGERRRIGAVIVWTLVLGCVIAAASTLYCQYSYPTPMNATANPQRNYFGAEYAPKREIQTPMMYFDQGRFAPKAYSPAVHVSIGIVVTLFLEIASLRWSSWPLLPVGYVASYGAFIENVWFSIFIGWILKVLSVRFGGAKLFESAKPFFVGIILGEALAAGFWIIVNAFVILSGGEPTVVKLLL